MTKTPQQIRNEVEKEIEERSSLFYENDTLAEQNELRLIVLEAQSNILTEYDKSIKEMIENVFKFEKNWINFTKTSRSYLNLTQEQKNALTEATTIMLTKIENELLSKIGDNSEVEK